MENLLNKSKQSLYSKAHVSLYPNNGHSLASESQEESKCKHPEEGAVTQEEKKSSGHRNFEAVFSDEFLFEALLEFFTFEETIRLISPLSK